LSSFNLFSAFTFQNRVILLFAFSLDPIHPRSPAKHSFHLTNLKPGNHKYTNGASIPLNPILLPNIKAYLRTKFHHQGGFHCVIRGDGFTSAEVDAVLHPSVDNSWTPTEDYAEFAIADLALGPRGITFQDRIANSYDQRTLIKKPQAAKGCVKCVVKDNSGAVTV